MIRTDLYPTGRKHCSQCRRWRLILDFGTRGGNDPYLRSSCRGCEAAEARVRIGLKMRGEPFQPRVVGRCKRGHSLTGANVYIYPKTGFRLCLTCRREYQRKWLRRQAPQQRERRREYVRFYEDARRRAEGQRQLEHHRKTPRDYHERLMLPAASFAEWLRDNAPAGDGARASWALRHGMDESTVRRLVTGRHRHVHIDVVDRAVGPDVLNELYPVDELVAA